MDDLKKIEVGDMVDVDFPSHINSLKECVVLYTPQDTGDSWRLQSSHTGDIYNVQLFCKMTLVSKAEKEVWEQR